MPTPLRFIAAQARAVARRNPRLHRPFHAAAELLAKTRWGGRFIRSVVTPESLSDKQYRAWNARYDRLSAADRRAIAAHIGRMADPPVISVVMPAYATSAKLVKAAIASVRRQLYPHWELCIADDASPGEALWTALEDAAAHDPRIKVVRRETNGHICAATNTALALATGEFVALMDHDDLLSEDALYEVAAAIEAQPDVDLIYSDEDKIDELDLRFDPYFKPEWSGELILGHNMVSHLGVYRTALLRELGGLREGFEGSQDYDLTLRFIERTTPQRIRHIPKVLYHWRQTADVASFSEGQMDRCADAARRAVAEHLARTGQAASVANQADVTAWVEVRRAVPQPAPLVSVIVPTRDRAELMARCAEGVLGQTDYQPLELVIVDNGSVEPATAALYETLATDPRVRIVPAPGPFNFAGLINTGAAVARGEVLVLLNNDVFVRDGGWLAELVAHAVRPSVGAVGAKLLFPDGSLQHGGVILGVGRDEMVAGHLYYGAEAGHAGYHRHLLMTRNVSAVTAACMALRKAVFDEVGGMDAEQLAVAFNDVDLCLKIGAAGYDIVWTPFAELTHQESASRGTDRSDRFRKEAQLMRERWGPQLDADPFYGPNFDRRHSNYRLAEPPRRAKPWVES